MGVRVQRQADVGMPESLLHNLGVNALLERRRGGLRTSSRLRRDFDSYLKMHGTGQILVWMPK